VKEGLMALSKTQRTRALIIETATQILSKNAQVTLNDIADAAGIGRATLHRHFKNRDELMNVLTREALRETEEACAPVMAQASSAKEALEVMFKAIIPLGNRYSFLANEFSVMSDPDIQKAYQRQLSAVSDLVSALKAEGNIASDVPNAWVTSAIDGLIYSAWSSVEEGYVARRDAGPLAVRTLLSGLGQQSK